MNLLNFLSSSIIGQLGDQIGTLWLGEVFFSKKYFLLDYYSIEFFNVSKANYLNFLFSDLYNFIFLSLASFLGGVLTYNLLTLFFLFLNSVALYFLLTNFKINKKISLIFAFFFSLIPYFYSHFEHHTLLIIFPSILVLNILFQTDFKKIELKKALLSSLLIALQGVFTLYVFYFLFLYLFLYFIVLFIKERSKKILLNFILIVIFSVTFFGISNFKLIYSYLIPSQAVSVYNFPDKSTVQEISSFAYDREKPLNDFIYFSSRPWYFVLFPSNHFLFGSFTVDLVKYFSETKDIWIFKNYFPAEHNSSFIGYTVLILVFYGLINRLVLKNIVVKNLLILNFLLLLFILPPYIPIGDKGFYTPSYLLYLFFPMFRSTARLSIFIQLNFFIIASFVLDKAILNKNNLTKYIICLLVVLGLSFDYVLNYKFVGYKINHETNTYLRESNLDKSMVAVYPNSFRNEFLLNMVFHENPFFNPSGFVREELNFDSSKFTVGLDSCENLKFFNKFNGKYLVIKDYQKFNFQNISRLETIFYSENEALTVKSTEKVLEICN